MENFRFGIMGAGGIAGRFCRAVSTMSDCEVAAVSSKSMERAKTFAENNGVPAFFDSYTEMLEKIRPDCVYIATTPDSHFDLTMLCLEHGVPVLCEKAMFVSSGQAETAFAKSEKDGIFTMEALWSRFLPANRRAKEWIDAGAIGTPAYMDIGVGFKAPDDPESRYMSKKLCGGAATDITCYAYELARLYISDPILSSEVSVLPASTGVDLTERITLNYENMLATLVTTFAAPVEERALICGSKGKIVIPFPHFASEALLYHGNELAEHFKDEGPDGFTYEIRETIECVRQGKTESPVVPHSLTLECAKLFDRIYQKL